MNNGKALRVLMVLAGMAALSACATVKSMTGLGQNNASLDSADESVKRPPLTLPPDYNLRPPAAATAAATTDFTAAQAARQAVFGLSEEKDPAANVRRKAGLSVGESALLQRAGASSSTPAIRQKVNKETEVLAGQEKTFVENLVKPTSTPPSDKQADSGWFSGIFSSEKKPIIERKSGGGLFGNVF